MRLLLFLVVLFVPSFSWGVFETVYDCGKGSTAIVTHPSVGGDKVVINGVQMQTNNDDFNLSFDCYSTLKVGCTDNDFRVVIIPKVESSQELTYRQIASFFVGSFAAMAFVVASKGDL